MITNHTWKLHAKRCSCGSSYTGIYKSIGLGGKQKQVFITKGLGKSLYPKLNKIAKSLFRYRVSLAVSSIVREKYTYTIELECEDCGNTIEYEFSSEKDCPQNQG